MNNDLISRSAVLDALKTEEGAAILGNSHVRYMKAKTLVEEIPAVDAVEVVRCKDCAWCKKPFPEHFPQMLECMRFDMEVAADEFCSRSERRAE